MKSIELEIDEKPMAGTLDENGDFTFYLYGSNTCDDEFQEALETLQHLWHLNTEVSLKINVRFKDIYADLYSMHNAQGKILKEDTPLFQALLEDCQWIIDQINTLEMNA